MREGWAYLATRRGLTALLGYDFQTYGLGEPDRRALDLFLRHHYLQGLAKRRFTIAELFAPFDIAQFA